MPLLVLWFFNYWYVEAYKNTQGGWQNMLLMFWYLLILVIIPVVSGRGCGNLNNAKVIRSSDEIFSKKPYLRKIMGCHNCKILSGYRSKHCNTCGFCVPKYSKHSEFLNQCIGAGNELPYLCILFGVVVGQILTLGIFMIPNNEVDVDWRRKGVMYLVNCYVMWQSLIEFSKILIFVKRWFI